jgi:7,8-dihydropterin-6-yl-methyl-4-(beta-D-ribofuranosyl)aminobenzene 5'-phosphate synthase
MNWYRHKKMIAAEVVAVDRLEITVLVDNVTDSLSSTPPFVRREFANLQRNGMRRLSGAGLCCANHGLALVVTAYARGSSHTVLFDGGPADYAVERNGTRLGVDFGGIEAVVLSHGHWDHAGGLPKAFDLMLAANGGRTVPMYLHPGMFRERGAKQGDGGVLPFDRVPPPDTWRTMGAEPVVTDGACAILDGHFLVSGEIPRVTGYEVGYPEQVARNGENAPWEPDPLLLDERFLAARIAGKGVVVFTACSHAGVVNVMRDARTCFPGERLYAVIGGFHLAGTNEEIIPQTVRDLGDLNIAMIIPAHCTGWRAVNALSATFGEAVVLPSAVGKSFIL